MNAKYKTEVKVVRLDALHEDPKNARLHGEDNLKAIGDSLEDWGQVEPLLVQASTGRIIAGNGRYRQMRARGDQEVTVTRIELTDAEADRLAIALNRCGELGHWSQDVLAGHLAAFEKAGHDARRLGFSQMELDLLKGSGGAGGGGEEGPGGESLPLPDPGQGPVPRTRSVCTLKVARVPLAQKELVRAALEQALQDAGLPYEVSVS